MKKLKLCETDIRRGNLILVNPSHPLKIGPSNDSLAIIGPSGAPVLMERQAAKMLGESLADLSCGDEIIPVSGYRTASEQRTIYDDSLRDHGEDFTKKFVAIPGCSEHQTGLAIDLAENKGEIDFIRPAFPYSGICQCFRLKSVKYGFIERYPKGCEQLTHIAHEPWHFRYVGYPHSELMAENRFTLEEYTDYLRQFSSRRSLRVKCSGRDFEIFFVPVPSDAPAEIEVPEEIPCQCSGNNEDGVVVTLWGSAR